MSDYAKYSGDYDGVVSQPDGTFVAKCTNDRWWYAPACRANASTCIPVFTAGTGWKAQPMMQWSTAYGMPTALGVSGGWSLFLKHVRTFQCLHYWWVPDSTFIQMLPEQLVFARHSANEWLAGDKKTGGAGSYVSKMVSNNLQSKAGRVREFLRSKFDCFHFYTLTCFGILIADWFPLIADLHGVLTTNVRNRHSWFFFPPHEGSSPTSISSCPKCNIFFWSLSRPAQPTMFPASG